MIDSFLKSPLTQSTTLTTVIIISIPIADLSVIFLVTSSERKGVVRRAFLEGCREDSGTWVRAGGLCSITLLAR